MPAIPVLGNVGGAGGSEVQSLSQINNRGETILGSGRPCFKHTHTHTTKIKVLIPSMLAFKARLTGRSGAALRSGYLCE